MIRAAFAIVHTWPDPLVDAAGAECLNICNSLTYAGLIQVHRKGVTPREVFHDDFQQLYYCTKGSTSKPQVAASFCEAPI